MSDQNQPRPTTVRLQRMVRAYRESAALMAGVELGLFTKVAEGGHTEASLSDALGITRLHGERIIVACVGLGLLDHACPAAGFGDSGRFAYVPKLWQ